MLDKTIYFLLTYDIYNMLLENALGNIVIIFFKC